MLVFPLAVILVTPAERERMDSLSLRIQEEKNSDKFATLLRELSQLVGRKARRLNDQVADLDFQRTRPWRTVPAVVQKIVKPLYPGQSEKVEIQIAAADDLFREVRIENTLTDANGQAVALKNGARVDVTFEADADDTVKKLTAGHA
jgi:hypothetical protein